MPKVRALSFDIKSFLSDAAQNGLQSTWYVTDIFGGFEIWNGSAAVGAEVTALTVAVVP